MEDLVVIGGGAAGLVAAESVARRGFKVLLLEARDRLGGRMLTIGGRSGRIPIELGAEFVHGAKNPAWDLIREAGLKTHEVPNRHWSFTEDRLQEDRELWGKIEEVLSSIDLRQPDRDLRSFLETRQDVSPLARSMVLEYVEGFHAADPDKVSIHSLVRSEKATERDQGDRQFRISAGYGNLVEWLAGRVRQAGVEVRLGTEVQSVDWAPGRVTVSRRSADGPKRFEAHQALITLPVGVLQQQGAPGLQFNPELPEKQKAIRNLVMGPVVKITLEFQSRFWPVDNFGFIHAIGRRFPTWWADERGAVLTAWAGGPRARQMQALSPADLQEQAIAVLAHMFKKDAKAIRDSLDAVHRHDWTQDRYSRGAYSFTTAGGAHSAKELAAPVRDTLYFAGEATDWTGEQGTVHGAIQSGRRAAKEILAVRGAKAAEWSPAK